VVWCRCCRKVDPKCAVLVLQEIISTLRVMHFVRSSQRCTSVKRLFRLEQKYSQEFASVHFSVDWWLCCILCQNETYKGTVLLWQCGIRDSVALCVFVLSMIWFVERCAEAERAFRRVLSTVCNASLFLGGLCCLPYQHPDSVFFCLFQLIDSDTLWVIYFVGNFILFGSKGILAIRQHSTKLDSK